MAKAIVDEKGRILCGACGQYLHESNTKCPICKEPVEDMNEAMILAEKAEAKAPTENNTEVLEKIQMVNRRTLLFYIIVNLILLLMMSFSGK